MPYFNQKTERSINLTNKRKKYVERNKGHDDGKKEGALKFLQPYIIGVVIALALVFAAKLMFGAVLVQGDSMNPTYYDGDLLRGQREVAREDIKRRDVITFKEKGQRLIKRVVGVPGDIISYKDHTIYINGEPETAEFPEIKNGGLLEKGKIRLGKNEYFCMGDNRNNSRDSRVFGPIRYSQIESKIIGTYYHKNKQGIY